MSKVGLMKYRLQKIQQDIRNLRDSANHICPHAQLKTLQEWVDEIVNGSKKTYPCTCESYDSVIDEVQDIVDNMK